MFCRLRYDGSHGCRGWIIGVGGVRLRYNESLAERVDLAYEQFVGCHLALDFSSGIEDGCVVAPADAPANFWKRMFGHGFREVAGDLAGSGKLPVVSWAPFFNAMTRVP
jgi:hypothetical protein